MSEQENQKKSWAAGSSEAQVSEVHINPGPNSLYSWYISSRESTRAVKDYNITETEVEEGVSHSGELFLKPGRGREVLHHEDGRRNSDSSTSMAFILPQAGIGKKESHIKFSYPPQAPNCAFVRTSKTDNLKSVVPPGSEYVHLKDPALPPSTLQDKKHATPELFPSKGACLPPSFVLDSEGEREKSTMVTLKRLGAGSDRSLARRETQGRDRSISDGDTAPLADDSMTTAAQIGEEGAREDAIPEVVSIDQGDSIGVNGQRSAQTFLERLPRSAVRADPKGQKRWQWSDWKWLILGVVFVLIAASSSIATNSGRVIGILVDEENIDPTPEVVTKWSTEPKSNPSLVLTSLPTRAPSSRRTESPTTLPSWKATLSPAHYPTFKPNHIPTSTPMEISPATNSISTVEALREKICSLLPSTCADMSAEGTPQSRALLWARSDLSSSYSEERQIQRYVLGVIYFSMKGWGSEGAPADWTDLARDECTWEWGFGDIIGTEKIICDEFGRVKFINLGDKLRARQKHKELPREVALLSKSLETLYFCCMGFAGKIPTEYGMLSKLKRLALDFNQLSGPVPTELGRLTSLEGLWLHKNNLTGTMPEEVCRQTRDGRLGWLDCDCKTEVECGCCTYCHE